MKTLMHNRRSRRLGPLLPFLLVILTAFSARGQSGTALSGTVQTAAGAAVEFATVTLHKPDSTVVKTEFSDAQGTFRFEPVPAGRYLVSAAQVGFVRRWTGPVELPAAGLRLPAIVLQPSGATALKGVTVVGQKPVFERLSDRTVVNVEGSTLAAGNSTLDVLSRAPGVTVDGSDNLALRGKQGLLVLIDGKRQPMSGTELADYLRALPADQLKSIELITNPPAKYDAQGGAGIIAINLKKDQRQGTNGSVNVAYGRGYVGKFNSGFSLNHKQKNLNLFGSYSFANRNGLGKLDIQRDFYQLQDGQRRLVGSSEQVNRLYPESLSNSGKVGADYSLGEKTVVGVVLTGLDSRIIRMPGTNFSTLYDATGAVSDRYVGTLNRTFSNPNGAANLNFKHTFTADSSGSAELTADADYARYRTHRLQDLTTRYELSGLPTTLLTSDQQGTLVIESAKADYTRPLPGKGRLEAGAKLSRVTSDNDVRFENTVEGVTQLDLNRSNRFKYNERISAGYLNYSRSFGSKLSAQAGLRGEQTTATGQQVVDDFRFSRNYFQLFPSASLKQTFSDRHEVTMSLSRRIDRPSYGQLNPFRGIIDPTTSGLGNPDLRPQTSYNVELTHTFKQKFSTGLSYSNTLRPIIDVVQPETDSTVISTYKNLTRQHYYALTLTAPVELSKWWTVYNNGVLYYNRFEGSLAGTTLNRGRAAFNLSSNSSFTFGKGWSAELNGSYQSREQYGFLDVQAYGQLAVGVQKAVWDRKGTLKLNATDLLFTNRTRATSTYDNYVERFYQRGDNRVVTLAFSYHFGNDKLAPARRRNGSADEEKRRAGGS